jgi:hypothetical protein
MRLPSDYKSAQAYKGPSNYLPAGNYVCAITTARVEQTRSTGADMLVIELDVAEGERKGAYAQSQYPPSDVLSWKDAALGMLKHKLHVLADHNPGFQSSIAFDNDDWQAFVGKRFGAVVRRRLYTAGPNSKSPGADRHQMEIAAYLSPDDLAANKFNRNLLEDRDQRDPQAKAAQAPASTEIADEDIPF